MISVLPALAPSVAGATTSISAVGSLTTASGSGRTTLSVSPQTAGDLLALSVEIPTTTRTVSSVSGGGVTTWAKAVSFGGSVGSDEEIWYGKVTTAGSATITVSWSGSISGKTTEYSAQEFSSSLGSSTAWSVDKTGTLNNSSSTTLTYPSLSPSAAGELYFGFVALPNPVSSGSTTGFTYATTSTQNQVTYNPNVSSPNAYQPTASQSPAGASSSLAAVFAASPSISAVGSFATASSTGLTTLSVNPQATGDLLTLAALVTSTSLSVSSVSGGGVTTWTKAAGFGGSVGADEEIWYGTVSTTGSSTITVTWSGSVAAQVTEYSAQEFSSSLGPSTAWSVDHTGTLNNSSSTTTTDPSLSPSGAGELYLGFVGVANSASGGSTSGFSYHTTATYNQVAYDTNVSAPNTYQPTATQSPAGASSSLAVTFTAAPSISAVGSLASQQGTGTNTLSVSPQATGDLLALAAVAASTSLTVSSVSGGGVTTWTKAVGFVGSLNADEEIWYGKVTSTGSSTITVTWSASVSGLPTEYSAQEFNSALGSGTTWSVDKTGSINNVTTSTITYPSLSPSAAGEVYFGYSALAATPSNGTTSGFTYTTTSQANQVTYDSDVSSPNAYQPTATESPAQDSTSVAAVFTTSSFAGASTGNVPASAMFGGSDPAEPGVTQGMTTVGDGVNPGTGDFSVTSKDAAVATYGPALSVTRTYDAQLAQQQTASGSSPGPFGYGWSSTPSLNTSTLTVTQASGAQVTFVAPSSGSCPAPYVGPGTSGTYCALPYVTAGLTLSGSTYTLTTHPYATYTFNSSGQLTSESTLGGASLTWTYGSPSPGSGSCPSTATSCNTETSASGRALVFGLNSSGLVTTVTDPRSDTWTYAYSSSNLTSVTDPLSRVTSYTYDTTNSNVNLRHDLLTLTQPNGQSGGSSAGAKLTNTYNTTGQVTQQVDPMGRTTSYGYTYMNATSGVGVVAVTDPDANIDDYYFKTDILDETVIGAGSSLVSDIVIDPSSSTLLPMSKTNSDGATTTYAYDSDGNVTSTTNALGEASTTKFNAFDEPVCSTMPMSASACSSLSPPTAVSPGGTITPPSSAPPAYAAYSLYDTSGNLLYTTMGVYPPGGSTASYSRTSYSLHHGNSVTLNSTLDQCGSTPPSTSLPCATINADDYVTQLGYDSSGDVNSSATPDGNGSQLATTTSSYDSNGDQASTTSPNGNLSGANAANYTTTTTFDADGEPIETVLAGGSGATFASVTNATYYDPDGDVVATTAPGGNPYSSTNTSGCNPLTTSTCGYTTYDAFDADNEKSLVTDPAGDETLTCYDGDGNVAQTVPPAGIGSLTPASCPTSYPSSYSASPLSSDATMTTYNAQGNQTVVTVPPATGSSTRASTTNIYDGAGQIVEVEAPPSPTSGGSDIITTSTYDLAGHLLTQTTVTGTSTPSTTSDCYDPDGDTTATVPGAGNVSGVAACGTSSPWGTSSSYQTSSSYDSAGELVSTTSPAPGSGSAATTTYTYDAVGNKLTSVIPASSGSGTITTTYTYNPLNQQTSEVTSSGGSALNYTDYLDASGNEVAVTSPGGNPYSSSNTSGCNPITTSTCSYTTYSTYNSSGQLLTSTNPDGQVTTNYYSSGLLAATTGPSGPGSCNPASATTSSNPCADTMDDFYNSSGQLTCTAEPNTANNTCSSPGSYAGIVKYTYTADGQRATMVDSTGTTTYTYDSSDRLTQVTNGASKVVTYAYGQDSDPTCVSYPNASNNTCTSPGSGLGIVNYTYNASNQLASITDWASNTLTYSYNATGQPTNLSVNSGAVGVATSYDDSGNVSSIDATASSGATTLLDLSVTRGENSNIATEVPVVGTTTMATDSFGYNADNQVNSGPIAGSTGSSSYSYVPDGGISQDTNTFASAAYDTADVLCWTSTTSSTNACGSPPSGATTYTSNADGERTLMTPTSGNSAAYAWDSPTGDLLCANTNGTSCSTSSPTSSTTVYTYNGDALRATSTISSTTTNYTWGQIGSNPQLLSDGTWDYVYVPGSSVPVEQVAASGSSPAADLLLSDPNGSVRGIVQLTSGTHQDQLVNYSDYDAYGNPITQAGGSVETGGLTATQTSINANYVATTPFGFGGGYTDETGLIYLVHRYYDPVPGEFLSVDPELATTDQAYEYADDNPANETDPTGKWVVGICGSGGYGRYIGWVGAGACLVRTVYQAWDDIGFTFTGGFGLGTPGLGAAAGILISNATHICDLGGWFTEISGSGLGYGVSVFGGSSPCGGGYIVGVVLQKAWGKPGIALSYTYTWTYVERNGWIANPLRWAWDLALGGVSTAVMYYWLQYARSRI